MEKPADRRRTARIPAGARLLLRAVGMRDYALCDVSCVSTLSLDLSLDRKLATGTVVTVLALQENTSKTYRRAVGSVERWQEKGGRWMHMIKASNKRPWSSMFIYDVVYQTLVGSGPRSEFDLLSMEIQNGPSPLDGDGIVLPGPANGIPQPGLAEDALEDDGHLLVYRALAWFSPFRDLNSVMRGFIARDKTLSTARAGTTLIECGSDDDVSIFLVNGVLEVEAFDGRKVHVVAGTSGAQFPISLLRPHACTVKAATDVTVILLSQKVVREIVEIAATCRSRLGIEVSEDTFIPEDYPGYPRG